MKTIRRVLAFDRHDWRHIGWLFGRMVNGWWRGDLDQIMDAWQWIVIHITMDSHRIK